MTVRSVKTFFVVVGDKVYTGSTDKEPVEVVQIAHNAKGGRNMRLADGRVVTYSKNARVNVEREGSGPWTA